MDHSDLIHLQLTNLHQSKIQVRLARKWEGRKLNITHLPSTHMILIDEYVSCDTVILYVCCFYFLEKISNNLLSSLLFLFCEHSIKEFMCQSMLRYYKCLTTNFILVKCTKFRNSEWHTEIQMF